MGSKSQSDSGAKDESRDLRVQGSFHMDQDEQKIQNFHSMDPWHPQLLNIDRPPQDMCVQLILELQKAQLVKAKEERDCH